jgi:membrane protease YdiL (CAAX protease family)
MILPMRVPTDALLVSVPTTAPSRARQRVAARDRVAIPLVPGVLAALAATAIGIGASFLAVIALTVGGVLALGTLPSTAPGHPLLILAEIAFYAAAGAFAWWRLRRLRPGVLRMPSWRALAVVAIGLLALVAANWLLNLQLLLTHQTTHVQAGFQGYNVVTRIPTVTAINVGLNLFSFVVLGPLVEEIIFRGLLFGALASRLGVAGAGILSAAIFGAVHGDPVLFVWLAVVGLINAAVYAMTGNLTAAVMIHAIANALSAPAIIAGAQLHAR